MRRTLATLVLLGAAAGPLAGADPGDVERLRAENTRLQARVKELEAENAKLKGQSLSPLVAALEQTATASVQESYDSAAGVTSISTAPSQLTRTDGGRVRQWITLRADQAGKGAPARSANVQLVLETRISSGAYRSARTLHLALDGTAQDLSVVDYRSEPVTAGRSSTKVGERETVVVAVPLDTLTRMATAHDVRGTLGSFAFQLTPEQLATVRAFQQRVAG
jgi:hypothetical protein